MKRSGSKSQRTVTCSPLASVFSSRPSNFHWYAAPSQPTYNLPCFVKTGSLKTTFSQTPLPAGFHSERCSADMWRQERRGPVLLLTHPWHSVLLSWEVGAPQHQLRWWSLWRWQQEYLRQWWCPQPRRQQAWIQEGQLQGRNSFDPASPGPVEHPDLRVHLPAFSSFNATQTCMQFPALIPLCWKCLVTEGYICHFPEGYYEDQIIYSKQFCSVLGT